jgi:hypothetical protein
LISDKAQQAHLVSYWGLTMGFTVTGGEP